MPVGDSFKPDLGGARGPQKPGVLANLLGLAAGMGALGPMTERGRDRHADREVRRIHAEGHEARKMLGAIKENPNLKRVRMGAFEAEQRKPGKPHRVEGQFEGGGQQPINPPDNLAGADDVPAGGGESPATGAKHPGHPLAMPIRLSSRPSTRASVLSQKGYDKGHPLRGAQPKQPVFKDGAKLPKPKKPKK